MPTNTFFRLPEEKRQRLLDAAWGEFTRVSYVDVSINRIIQQAHIPRGSFYQYFSDKEELFYYLLEDVRSYFANLLGELLEETRGDLFAMTLAAFDRLVRRDGDVEETVDRCLQVMRRNQGMDIRILEDGERLLPDELAGRIDPSRLRSGERLFLEHVFFLLTGTLIYAVMTTIRQPQQRERQREILRRRVDIVRRGSLSRQEALRESQEGGDTWQTDG